ncbi:hypothetical protein BBJ28_00003529 [Nothophytophthora sp. Chile5]|nr:hypothetical protein BBJ28_00003529 [Nothophytophthora sp. Chile5]
MKSSTTKEEAVTATPVVAVPAPLAETPQPGGGPESASPRDSMTPAYQPPRVKIPFNPPAGEVHHRERDAPWRVKVEERTATTNARAQEEQREKRRWGLAKQTQDGLVRHHGINYGVVELATLIKECMALKSNPPSREMTPHEVEHVQFLAAVEKYDLKQLVLLVDKFPKGRGAASSGAKRQ